MIHTTHSGLSAGLVSHGIIITQLPNSISFNSTEGNENLLI